MSGIVGLTGQSPRAAWMSVWHSPLASILTSTCPGPGWGTGTSRISRGAPSWGTTAAFMASPWVWVRPHSIGLGGRSAGTEVPASGDEGPEVPLVCAQPESAGSGHWRVEDGSRGESLAPLTHDVRRVRLDVDPDPAVPQVQ